LEVFLAFSAILPGLLLVAVIHAVLGTAAAFVSLKIGDGNRVAYLLGILLCAVLVCTCAGLSFFALATEFPENGFVLFTTLPVGGLFATVLVYLVSHRVRERLALRRAA
jgi:biotin transporter BioY